MICDCIVTFLANSNLMLQISHAKTFKTRGIIDATTIIFSKVIDKYAFMCGSKFYETDVMYHNIYVHHMYLLST